MLNWIVMNGTDYLHKMDLALNNLQRLICHKTQQTNKPNQHTIPVKKYGISSLIEGSPRFFSYLVVNKLIVDKTQFCLQLIAKHSGFIKIVGQLRKFKTIPQEESARAINI